MIWLPQEDAEERFLEVSRAYDVLSDSGKREAYNRQLRGTARMSNFFRDVDPDEVRRV
jgi:DnaJ-class molecular chaperone